MAIKNIVFDLGGVLVKFDKQLMLQRNFTENFHKVVEKATFDSAEWQKMDSGELGVEEAVDIMVSTLPDEIKDKVRRMIIDKEEQMPLVEEMIPIIEKLYGNGYKLFILSNCAQWFHAYFKEFLPFNDKISGYVISSDYKTLKPQEEIYNIFLQKYGLDAQECLFIDDSPANIKTAENLGMHTHHFSFRNIPEFEQKISHLL